MAGNQTGEFLAFYGATGGNDPNAAGAAAGCNGADGRLFAPSGRLGVVRAQGAHGRGGGGIAGYYQGFDVMLL